MDKDYRIMIVDDERIVRDAIASPGIWKEYPVSVVKAASNAIEALEYMEEHEVDLVLTDIKMPVMDGIQLIRRVKTRRPETEFIILSGYAEFSYAQEALRYGARDYLLKPLDEETLVSIVLKCAQAFPIIIPCSITAVRTVPPDSGCFSFPSVYLSFRKRQLCAAAQEYCRERLPRILPRFVHRS